MKEMSWKTKLHCHHDRKEIELHCIGHVELDCVLIGRTRVHISGVIGEYSGRWRGLQEYYKG